MHRALLEIADEMRALAGSGLFFTESHFDRDRYERLMQLAARLAAVAGGGSPEKLEEIFLDADHGYVTPKLDVRLAIFREDRVLLVREARDGRWTLPGGYVDVGDSPAEAAIRETAEEAGVEARVVRLVGILDNRLRPEIPPRLFQVHKLLFLGELRDPRARPHTGHETTDAGFHPVAGLPDLSLGRTVPFHIELALQAYRNPAAPTYFE